MPRLLSPEMIREKNRLHSTHVLSALFEVTIPGAPAPYRLAAYDQDIVFHGLSYLKFPVTLDALEDPTSQSLARMRLTIGNVDQGIQSLLENYWQEEAFWYCTTWFPVDMSQPDQTSFASGEVFVIAQVATDFMSAVADLQAAGLTLSGTIPKRRFSTSGGFPFIPRRQG